MPIQQPAVSNSTINDLIPKVAAYLQNRSDINETQVNPELRPSAWIRDTLRELTANYPFEELKVFGPLVTIGPGLGFQNSNYMYPVSQFLNPGDDLTLTWDPVIFLTPTQAASVGSVGNTTNQVGYAMDRVSLKAIQPLLFIPGGVPFKYCRHGNMFLFGTQPGQLYTVYLPYQVRHPFTDSLPNSPVKVPRDWHDIVAIGAAERGAITLRWNEQATYLHSILYGDPEYQASGGVEGRPGLIAGRMLQEERDSRLSPVQIIMGVGRY